MCCSTGTGIEKRVGADRVADIDEKAPVTSQDGSSPENINHPVLKRKARTRLYSISGVVTDASGKPLEDVKLRILPLGRQDAMSDAEGKFRTSWSSQDWRGQSLSSCYVLGRHEELNLAAIQLLDEDQTVVELKLEPSMTLSGQVLSMDRQKISNATVSVALRIANWASTINREEVKVDAQGKFVIRAMPLNREYWVTVQADGFGRQQKKIAERDAEEAYLDLDEFHLPVANLSLSGRVVDVNDKPVSNAIMIVQGGSQPNIRDIRTNEQGKFKINNVCTGRILLSAIAARQNKPPIHGQVETKGGAAKVKIVAVTSPKGQSKSRRRTPPSLKGTHLPDLGLFGAELSNASFKGKRILVCFWDMLQHPSRHCLCQLANRISTLASQDVTVIAVQTAPVERSVLDRWLQKNRIPFKVGMIPAEEVEIKFNWGVRSLPWLILTDREHVIHAQGFRISDLARKLETKNRNGNRSQ